MKKFAIGTLIGLLLLVLTAYVFREPLKQQLYDMATADMFVDADTDTFDPGPRVGSRFPGVTALYRGEQVKLIDSFAGPKGTVFMASRSFDWCPYCMKQMIKLNEVADQFNAAGIGLVAITYDTPEQQQVFAKQHNIRIPILSDIDALSFKTLGILNENYQPGDDAYGIPHPGMIIIDTDGVVVGKLFLEAYSSRVSAEASLAYALTTLNRSSSDSL